MTWRAILAHGRGRRGRNTLIKGPNVFSGYLDARHNTDIWVDIEGETWLNTGDLGRQDKHGYFWLSGRRKELIIRGGHNIDPKMIEDALLKHPAVALAAAIGSPDAYAGEVPVAYVQTKPGAAVTDQELLDFAAAHIPERAAVPKRVKIVSSLPVTGVGKIFKPALQRLEMETVVRVEARKAGATITEIAHDRDARGATCSESGPTGTQRRCERPSTAMHSSRRCWRATAPTSAKQRRSRA